MEYPIGITRLVQLADHLKYGKTSHKVFDFTRWHSLCGTLGCAIGECPTVFPGEWEFANNSPVLKGTVDTEVSIRKFFNFSVEDDYPPLFAPGGRTGDTGYGKTCYLPDEATREEVADNILAYVEWKCQQLGLPVVTTLKAPIIPVFTSMIKKHEAEAVYYAREIARSLLAPREKEKV